MLLAQQKFRVSVHGADALEKLDWPSTNDSGPFTSHVFQSREFLTLWLETIGKARRSEPHFAVVSDSCGQPLMLLPLCVEHSLGFSVLRFMDGGVADYNAPIIRNGEYFKASEFVGIWSQILNAIGPIDAVDLRKIVSHIGSAPNPMLALKTVQQASSGYLIETSANDWDAFSKEKRRKKELTKARRKLNQLTKEGPVRFTIAETPDEARTLWRATAAMKRTQYLETMGEDFFEQPGIRAFYEGAISGERLNRLGVICARLRNDTVIAGHLGFRAKNRFHYILPAYNRDYASYGPGRQLLIDVIRWSFESGHEVLDLGEGDLDYKKVWSTKRLTLVSHGDAITWSGRLYFLLKAAKSAPALRRLYNRMKRAEASEPAPRKAQR